MRKRETGICLYCQWHRALQPSPAGLVVTQDVNQPCENSVSLLISPIISPISPISMKLHAPSSLLTTGINSTVYQLLSGLLCWLQELLSFPPVSSAPYNHWAWRVSTCQLQIPKWYPFRYQVALLQKVALSPGTWSLCLCFSLSITPAGTHFKTCGSCSAINTNIHCMSLLEDTTENPCSCSLLMPSHFQREK